MPRALLVAIVLALAGPLLPFRTTVDAAPAAISQQAQAPSATPSPVGSWLISFPGMPGNEHQLASFTSDGIFIGTNSPTSPPDQGPPGVGRTYSTEGLGAWQRASDGSVQLTFISVDFDENGTLVDTVKIIGTFQLSPDGNSLSGKARVAVADPTGSAIAVPPEFSVFNVTGIRIGVEPF